MSRQEGRSSRAFAHRLKLKLGVRQDAEVIRPIIRGAPHHHTLRDEPDEFVSESGLGGTEYDRTKDSTRPRKN